MTLLTRKQTLAKRNAVLHTPRIKDMVRCVLAMGHCMRDRNIFRSSTLESYFVTRLIPMMHRRGFVGALAGASPSCGLPQKPSPSQKCTVSAFCWGATGESVASLSRAPRDGLRELGYVEGRNIVFVQRYGDGKMERLPDLVLKLVRVKVDVIVTGTKPTRRSCPARDLDDTRCEVFAADPVGAGFIASLPARPGGKCYRVDR